MHGNAAAARNVTDDLVARNRIAALARNTSRSSWPPTCSGRFADPQHALDGGDEPRGLGIFAVAVSAPCSGSPSALRKNLPRGEFPVTQIGEQIFELRDIRIRKPRGANRFGNFLQAAPTWRASRSSRRRPTSVAWLRSMKLMMMADLAARAGSAHKVQPVAAGDMALLRQDLDDVAVERRCRNGTIWPFTFAPMH